MATAMTDHRVAVSFIRTEVAGAAPTTNTVGPGISPDLLTRLALSPSGARGLLQVAPQFTAGGESHPALRTLAGLEAGILILASLLDANVCAANARGH